MAEHVGKGGHLAAADYVFQAGLSGVEELELPRSRAIDLIKDVSKHYKLSSDAVIVEQAILQERPELFLDRYTVWGVKVNVV